MKPPCEADLNPVPAVGLPSLPVAEEVAAAAPTSTTARVSAIIVLYHPEPEQVRQLLAVLRTQVVQVVLVDNGGSATLKDELAGQPKLIWLALPHNVGLAAALNLGIRSALGQAASHVVLFDQDSLPAPDMVACLLAAEARLLALDRPFAALGPLFADARHGQVEPVLGPECCYTRRKRTPDADGVIEAGYLITSGQLISVARLAQIGLMREDLFIDAIDIEWGLRARHLGLPSLVVAAAAMHHRLGDAKRQIGSRQVALHSPLRHYYIIRNAVLLIKNPDLDWRWKCSDSLKTLRRLIVYPILCPQPFLHLRYMLRGLWDGVRGRAGPAPAAMAKP